jgi:hypothetical protein
VERRWEDGHAAGRVDTDPGRTTASIRRKPRGRVSRTRSVAAFGRRARRWRGGFVIAVPVGVFQLNPAANRTIVIDPKIAIDRAVGRVIHGNENGRKASTAKGAIVGVDTHDADALAGCADGCGSRRGRPLPLGRRWPRRMKARLSQAAIIARRFAALRWCEDEGGRAAIGSWNEAINVARERAGDSALDPASRARANAERGFRLGGRRQLLAGIPTT